MVDSQDPFRDVETEKIVGRARFRDRLDSLLAMYDNLDPLATGSTETESEFEEFKKNVWALMK
ncbi:MAG: hypothetical protein V4473_01250 [Patescibacteria group bacterium]